MFKKLFKSKTRIIPTWRLWLSLLMVLIAMFAAINYQKSVLHWLAYSMLFIFSGSIVYNLFSIMGLTSIWKFKNRIFYGESIDLALEITEGPTPSGIVLIDKHPLDSNINFTVGLHTLSNLCLFTEYPFGYFKTYIKLPNIEHICVYPKPIDHKDNAHNTSASNITDVFRPFRPGDSPRRVLKKTMALPQNKWQSKKDSTEDKHFSETELDWYKLSDQLSNVEKLEQLSFLIKSMPENTKFSMVLPSKLLRSGFGNTHKHQAWKILAETWQQLNLS